MAVIAGLTLQDWTVTDQIARGGVDIAGLEIVGLRQLVDFRIPGAKILRRAANKRRQSKVTSKTVRSAF